MKIAVISDLHFSRKQAGSVVGRVGKYADIFLLRAVHRLKGFLRPDLVFIGGDLLEDPDMPDAAILLGELKKILELLDMPVIVIPGNHDPVSDEFYKVMPRPPEYLDVCGCRFIPFPDDPQTTGWNARREHPEIERMKLFAAGNDGPSVSLQHVPIFPFGTCKCPYNYDNCEEIITAMRMSGVSLSIGCHYHTGFQIPEYDGVAAVAAPALCEAPFRFLAIELDVNGKVTGSEIHSLAMPEELYLTDYHVHTRFAYCNENMDVAKALELAVLFNLDRISFSEHSAHLYLNKKDYYATSYYPKGIAVCKLESRMDEYFAELGKVACQKFLRGLEIDFDSNGHPVIREEHLKRIDIRIGAVHFLEESGDISAIKDEFMFQTRSILSFGVDILAHPFRVFRRRNQPAPKDLFIPVADLLKETGTAMEINFHTNTPDPEFVLICIERGVKIAFGSDAHNLYEIGEFHPHLKLLESIGYSDRTEEILFKS